MKDLAGSARSTAAAPPAACYALLADVERYPEWYPDAVRAVTVLDRDADGLATRARATLHVARGPLVRDFELTLAIEQHPTDAVVLTRVPHEPSDEERFIVDWHLSAAGETTEIRLALTATLSVPRMVPLGGLGDAIAEGFVAAATRRLSRNP